MHKCRTVSQMLQNQICWKQNANALGSGHQEHGDHASHKKSRGNAGTQAWAGILKTGVALALSGLHRRINGNPGCGGDGGGAALVIDSGNGLLDGTGADVDGSLRWSVWLLCDCGQYVCCGGRDVKSTGK